MDENHVKKHTPRPGEMTTHENSGNLGTSTEEREGNTRKLDSVVRF
jgi:hypothetical protein